MKKMILSLGLIVMVLGLVMESNIEKSPIRLISPLLNNEKGLGINQWFPKNPDLIGAGAPKISAEGALFLDSKSGQVLFSKNPNKRLPVASLVKVMTVLVALEYKGMDDEYLVSQKAQDAEPDKMLLIAGEKMSLKELLYGIFLISANDAAEVIAEGTVGNRQEFIKLMNEKADQLGMKDTYFANPTGLDEDSNNSYSTAFDLAILTRYLIKHYPEVLEISKTEHIYLPVTDKHQDYDMYTGINLLTTYPGVLGFKTGYTPEAGLTLITLARKDKQEVLGVLLGSGDRRDEARELLDYSFKKLK